MEEIRENLDKILDLCAHTLSFEFYEKIFKLVISCNENLDLIEEWYCEKD